jgi:hypothetical protein
MGWMCITSTCKVTDGDWNNEGFAVFSIGDEMMQLHQKFFDFLAQLADLKKKPIKITEKTKILIPKTKKITTSKNITICQVSQYQ